MDYTINDLHYNSRGIPQVSAREHFEDLAATLKVVESELRSGSNLEQNMFSFFKGDVEPTTAYRDNDVNQGYGGPRRLFVVGRLKWKPDDGLFVRLGVRALGENPLIPALQVLYLGKVDLPLQGQNSSDRWFYDFTDRYRGRVEIAPALTRMGQESLSMIPAFNQLLNGQPQLSN